MTAPIKKTPTFTPVSSIFPLDSRYRPQFKNSQKTPLSPYVNQLANSAEMRLSRSLKTGIASAMIHATVQRTRTMSAQTPKLDQVRLLMRSVPR